MRIAALLRQVSGAVMLTTAFAASSQTFPSKPVTVINSYTAGGMTDLTIRSISELASKHLGQRIVVDNRPGASGVHGPNEMAKTTPDGYTLAQFTTAVLRLPYTQPVAYDPRNDFTYITAFFDIPMGIVVPAESRFKTFGEFVAAAKAKPDSMNYAVAGGAGTAGHLAMEVLMSQYGFKVNMVPFKGADYLTALLGGHVDSAMDSSSWAALVDSGKLRLLAVAGDNRLKRWPASPTFGEQGFPVALAAPFGLIGPKGLDPKTLQIIERAYLKAMEEPDFNALLEKFQLLRWTKNSAEFTTWAKTAYPYQGTLLKKVGLATITPP
jgi:tripartite-type tricarboxylate transporter receptor subunit TctC